MIKLFSHYLHTRTLLQVFFDLALIVLAVSGAFAWQSKDFVATLPLALTTGTLLGIATLAVNSGLGFYQRVHNRSVTQSRARALMALTMIVILAFGIFKLIPHQLEDSSQFGWAVVATLVLVLAHQCAASMT